MNQRRTVKKTIDSKFEGNRRKERQRLRWLEDAGKDLWEMNVMIFWQKAVDRKNGIHN